LLPDFQDTTVGYGAEFRPIEDLKIIFGQHPNFDFFKITVMNGMDYHFTSELNENERMEELLAQMARGNHSSATSDLKGLNGMTGKDVTKGFSLPLPVVIIPKLKSAAVQLQEKCPSIIWQPQAAESWKTGWHMTCPIGSLDDMHLSTADVTLRNIPQSSMALASSEPSTSMSPCK
jgi:hypothetical protein